MQYLTSQAGDWAASGATHEADPVVPVSVGKLAGGAFILFWESNWAWGTEPALGSDDGWMYDDGVGGPNGDCTSSNHSGCWGHRDNILTNFAKHFEGCPAARQQVVMGTAHAATKIGGHPGQSFAELFAVGCGPKPTGVVATWTNVKRAIGAH